MQRKSPLDRFWSKVNYLGKWSLVNKEWSQCWEWTGGVCGKGYGNFWLGNKCYGSHRWIYIQLHGPLDSKIELDHLCRNKICVRDSHLEPVSHKENVLRGIGPTAINAHKDTCSKGHLLIQDGTRRNQRYCRECDLEEKRNYYNTKGKFLPINREQVKRRNEESWERMRNNKERLEERNRKKRKAWKLKYSSEEYKQKRRTKYKLGGLY